MIKVPVAIAGTTALVCAPADVLYLGGTGQQGMPTQAGRNRCHGGRPA